MRAPPVTSATLPFGSMSLEVVEETQSPFHYLTHWLDRGRQYFIGRDLADAFAQRILKAAAP